MIRMTASIMVALLIGFTFIGCGAPADGPGDSISPPDNGAR